MKQYFHSNYHVLAVNYSGILYTAQGEYYKYCYVKYHDNLPWYFNPRKSKYCTKLQRYFHNIGFYKHFLPWLLVPCDKNSFAEQGGVFADENAPDIARVNAALFGKSERIALIKSFGNQLGFFSNDD
jgi:hypothetical protein